MPEVLISFQRPESMTETEMHAWVIDRVRQSRQPLVLSAPDGAGAAPRLLRMELDGDSVGAADEELLDLMMDMRLLGLRPAVVSCDRSWPSTLKMGTSTDRPS